MENLRLNIRTTNCNEYQHIICDFTLQKQDNIISCPDGYDVKPTENYQNLSISCQIGGMSETKKSYGYSIEYKNIHNIDLGRVNGMQKTLAKIDRQLSKIYNTRGMCKDFAEFAGRVAEVTKSGFVAYNSNNNDIRFMNILDGISKIRSMEQELLNN